MQNEISKEVYIKLLEELEQGTITKEEFYQLLDIPTGFQIYIIEIIKHIKEDREKIFQELIHMKYKCIIFSRLKNIITKYPVYGENRKRFTFLIENINSVLIDELANFFKYDFLFEDEELLKQVLTRTKQQEHMLKLITEIKDMSIIIDNELEEYETGEKNRILTKCFQLDDPKKMQVILELSDIKAIQEEPIWLEDLVSYVNRSSGIISAAAWYELQRCGRMEILTELLKKIHQKKIASTKKQKEIFNLLINMSQFNLETTSSDDQFNFLIKKIPADPEEFELLNKYAKVFIVPESICSLNITMSRKIIKLKNKDVQELLLDALNTSLKSVITPNLLDELMKEENASIVEEKLRILAVQNNCMDYIEDFTSIDINTNYFDLDFITYMTENKNLTKEQLLAMKKEIQSTKATCDGEKMIITIPSIKKQKILGRN